MAVPLLVAGGLLAAGAAAGGAIAGVGKDKYKPTNFGESKQYDANRFNFAGDPNGADKYAQRYQGQTADANRFAGDYRQQQQGLYGMGESAWNRAAGSENAAAMAAGQTLARAQSGGRGIAGMVADVQSQQVAQQQAGLAASARGPAAIALAQQQAANNTANAQQGIASQEMVNRAQEQLQAEQAAAAAFTGLANTQVGRANAAYGAGQASGQLGLGYGQLGMGYAGLDNQVRGQEMQGGIAQQQLLAGSQAQQQAIASGASARNAQNDKDMFAMGLGAAQGGLSGIGKIAGARAMGGPVAPGVPYLVGEMGPELVVPAQPGMVIPSHQTMGLLQGAYRG